MLSDSLLCPPTNFVVLQLAAIYLSVHPKESPLRPQWLDQREELSHFALSLSSQPLGQDEMRAIASRLASEHSFGDADCKSWAMSEAKWLLAYLNKASTLMAGFMALPADVAKAPGPSAPAAHAHAGVPMRVAMVHTAFLVLAGIRRVQAIQKVSDESGFTVHDDGSVSRTTLAAAGAADTTCFLDMNTF